MTHCQIDRKNSVETWTINRPDRGNAIGPTIANELKSALANLQLTLADWPDPNFSLQPEVRILVIRAQKTSHPHPLWIAGGDLIELAAIADKEQAAAYAKSMIEICLGLESLPIPVICAIDGQAIGGGVELALAADLRIASASAQFEFKQLKVGLATGYGGASRLSSLLGLSRAKGLLMLTEKLKAHDALAIGLIHKLVSDKRINDGIQALVDDLLALNANALAVQKKMLHFSRDMSFQNCQEQEFSFFQKLWRNPSHSAFLDQFSKRRS